MQDKKKKKIKIKKNSLEHIVFLFVANHNFRTSASIRYDLECLKNKKYPYNSIKKALYRLRDKQLVQCYGQRWTLNKKIKIICEMQKI